MNKNVLINPFTPHRPAIAEKFVGRLEELGRLEGFLRQTRKKKPIHFMICGERGIGKTSLLNYIQSMARRYPNESDEPTPFLVIGVQMETSTTQGEFVRKIELALRLELDRTEVAKKFLKQTWDFVQRIEIAGVKIRDAPLPENSSPMLWEEFANSLVVTAERICSPADPGDPFGAASKEGYNGILILIDEADTTNDLFNLGTFLKYLTEYFQRHHCYHIAIGLSGLPSMIDTLMRSHRSALRIFDELRLDTLSKTEVDELIDLYLMEAASDNDGQFAIEDEARDRVYEFAEGHPHFVQQVCFCAFKAMDRRIAGEPTRIDRRTMKLEIKVGDVISGAFEPRGSLDMIGDIYYRATLKPELEDGLTRRVLAYLSQFLRGGVPAADVAREVGLGRSAAAVILERLVHKGLVRYREEPDTYLLSHRCLAYWLQKAGRGQEIQLGNL